MMNHKELHVWQRSIEFVSEIYKILESIPKTETFGLTDQFKRASISIPSNIAEGSARGTEKEQVHFFYISRGFIVRSGYTTLNSQKSMILIRRKTYEILEKLTIIGKMLTKLIQSLS